MITNDPDTQPDTSGPRVDASDVRDLAALRRSRTDKKVGGVAGGLARHLDIDPLLVRVTLVVLIFFGGAGLIVYGACWLLVPLEGESRAAVRLDDRSRAVALVLVGVLATLSLLGDSLGGFDFPWALVVLGTVLALVLFFRGRGEEEPFTPGSVPAGTPAGTPAGAPAQAHPPVARSRRRGPLLFWYAVAISLLGVGILAVLESAGVPIIPSAYPAFVLGTSAVLLVVGAVWGRPGGLVALGLVSALVTAGVTLGERLDVGQVARTPSTSSALLEHYELDVGEIEVDLTAITDLDALDGRTLEVDLRVGRVEVVVPDGLEVTARTRLDAGEIRVFGSDGPTGESVTVLAADDGAPRLTIDVTVGLGDIEIIHEGAR
ncbi:PspC domain-containing protein [Nocardioides sp.]|uniref:PspC domain-containing protein n=1 Tax=Nocardioides sp. TaxID=35761 RepID=UPI002B26E793|nr:PspC domain-containing protein [Nocardioides sp.]